MTGRQSVPSEGRKSEAMGAPSCESRRTIFALGVVARNVQTLRDLKGQMLESEAETVSEQHLPGLTVAQDLAPIAATRQSGNARFASGRGCPRSSLK